MVLKKIAYISTGHKDNLIGISVHVRKPKYYPLLKKYMTTECVKKYLSDTGFNKVTKYSLDSVNILNFLLENTNREIETVSIMQFEKEITESIYELEF